MWVIRFDVIQYEALFLKSGPYKEINVILSVSVGGGGPFCQLFVCWMRSWLIVSEALVCADKRPMVICIRASMSFGLIYRIMGSVVCCCHINVGRGYDIVTFMTLCVYFRVIYPANFFEPDRLSLNSVLIICRFID